MERLSDALCHNTAHDSNGKAAERQATPRCYFYGPKCHDHPYFDSLKRQLGCDDDMSTSCTSKGDKLDEATTDAIEDRICKSSCTQPAQPDRVQSSQMPSAALRSGHVLLLSSNNMLEGSTGCYVWPAGLWLAQWLLNHPETVSGRRCLELGAGTGLVSVVCAQMGAKEV